MDDFRELFNMFDANHNGAIELAEFTHILHMLGDDAPSGKALETMLRVACDAPPPRPVPPALTFDHFMRFFALHKQPRPAGVTDAQVFEVLDRDAGGSVSVSELGSVLARFGMRVSEDEAAAMAEFATSLPRANHIYPADMVGVGHRVRKLRQSRVVNTDTSDTSGDDTDTPTNV